ncbi:hypothetical protein [Pseudescherichia sp.]|uniref:hypothetical protein n=1 Tax=Pseudescherichia sp. TaxID=2055881 RepID=UPI0028996AF8|nr:hypothetical protein [Pseudescherichia sp.]
MKIKIIFLAIVLQFSAAAFANQYLFDSYHVDSIYKGKNHSFSESPSGNNLVDSIRIKISKMPPNFAGHYTIYTFGCGGGARCGEIYDVNTGKVISGLPNAYLVNDFDLSFKKDSSLIIISGTSADAEYDKDNKKTNPTYRERYYNFKDGVLVLLSEK